MTTMTSKKKRSTTSSSSNTSSSNRSKDSNNNNSNTWKMNVLQQLQDAIPKLKRTMGRKSARQALWTWFESQRQDLLEGLRTSLPEEYEEKVHNLKQLLSLPLEISDLESCLNLGVAGALQEQCIKRASASAAKAAGVDMRDIDADAEFLAKLLVGGRSSDNDDSSSDEAQQKAQELLDHFAGVTSSSSAVALRPDATTTTGLSSTTTTTTTRAFHLGRTAQLTSLVLMVAQILIGAQLLRRYRKRKTLQTGPAAASTAATSAFYTPEETFRKDRSDRTSVSDSGLSSTEGRHRPVRRRSMSASNVFHESLPALDTEGIPPSQSPPPPPSSVARASTSSSSNSGQQQQQQQQLPSLKKHLKQTTQHDPSQKQQQQQQRSGQQSENDDDRTAETDSLSLSEGLPKNLLEDQNSSSSHSRSPPHQEPADDTTATTPTPTTHNGVHHALTGTSTCSSTNSSSQEVLALLSFEGGTRDQLDAGSNRTLTTHNHATSVITRHLNLELPGFLQDKFSLRMSKLKNELFTVQREQKSKLKDSTHHVQLRYQETNKQYSDLTKRLETLTRSIQPKHNNHDNDNNNNALVLPTNGNRSTTTSTTRPLHEPYQSTTTTSTTTTTASMNELPPLMVRPPSPKRCPTPAQMEAHAKVNANNQETAKLLQQLTSLQSQLESQQDRHVQELQQKEARLAELSTRIQFLSHELERRVLHSKQLQATLDQQALQQGHASTVSAEITDLKQQQTTLAAELQETKHKFALKEQECQDLLTRLRTVPPPAASKSAQENEEAAQEHRQLMIELEAQLEQQDKMNQRTFQMTQMLEVKRNEIIQRTQTLESMSREIEERRTAVEQMEAEAAMATAALQQQSAAASVASSSSGSTSNEELEEQLHELQSQYEMQALECQKLEELLNNKSKLLQEKEKECHELTSRLEEMTAELAAKEARIEQLEQDVQDKQDLAAQNEAITTELQVQQELQEKMNQTTLQMIQLLEEKEQSNADLTNKLEALTSELNHSKKSL